MTAEDDAAALPRPLHQLDAEIDLIRRRIYAVQKGLAPVADPERGLAPLESRLHDLGCATAARSTRSE